MTCRRRVVDYEPSRPALLLLAHRGCLECLVFARARRRKRRFRTATRQDGMATQHPVLSGSVYHSELARIRRQLVPHELRFNRRLFLSREPSLEYGNRLA